jgi:hypothetical protein
MKVALVILPILIAVGCAAETRTFDLDSIDKKVSTGMSELQVTQLIGAPSHIDIEGDTRKLRYDGKDGGYILVTLKGNVVIDARRH